MQPSNASTPPSGPRRGNRAEFAGLAVNAGRVCGRVCLYSASRYVMSPIRTIDTDAEAGREVDRFRQALKACSLDLDRISARVARDVGTLEAEIFATQKHIMNDPAIVEAVTRGVREERVNLERVIAQVFGQYEEKFAQLDNEYLRERSTDLGEIRRRLLDYLHGTRPGFICQGQEYCSRGRNRVIVAEELTADMMAHMNLEHVLAIVTEHGGISSHAAIIARSVGVPAVSGVHGIFDHIECGTRVLVDGDEGRVLIDPDEETVQRLVPVDPVASEQVCVLRTPDGMQVLANASLMDDVRMADAVHADGIGLFRTEILFMRAGRLLTAEEQEKLYGEVIDIMGNRPVTFRLLDVGGDKDLPFLHITREANPYLGWRGARFLLGNREVFADQVRALVRVARRAPVRILFPMVIDDGQVGLLCEGVREIVSQEGGRSENVRLGAMFEVPSACLQAEVLLKRVDFGSIGSNDLIQYLFAVDRDNEQVSRDYNPEHPVLWEVLRGVSRAASAAGKELSICGEMAGRHGTPDRLIDIGIRSLSVSPRLVPRVRNEMANHRTGSMGAGA